LDAYFTNYNLIGEEFNLATQSESKINTFGIITHTQGLYDEYIFNDGFRFFGFNPNTGDLESLHHWNYDKNAMRACVSVSRIDEKMFIFAINNSAYLVISRAH